MSQTSPDAKAVVRAAEALTTQVRRIADALETPVVDVAEAPTTTPDFTSPLTGIEVRQPCPYCGDRQMIPRRQFDEHVARLHPDVRTSPAAEEDACLTHIKGACDGTTRDCVHPHSEQTLRLLRRESLLVLLTRLQRGRTLSSTEADALRQHVETEIREADTVRAVAAGNKRHVQVIVPELEQAQAAIERARAECKAIAHEVYGQHDEDDDGKREAVGRVIAALDGTEQQPTGNRLCHATDPGTLRECALRHQHNGPHQDGDLDWAAEQPTTEA